MGIHGGGGALLLPAAGPALAAIAA